MEVGLPFDFPSGTPFSDRHQHLRHHFVSQIHALLVFALDAIHLGIGHREDACLAGREPEGEVAGVVPDEEACDPLDQPGDTVSSSTLSHVRGQLLQELARRATGWTLPRPEGDNLP